MTGTMKNTVLIALIVVVGLYVFYQYDPSLMGLLRRADGFDNPAMANPNYKTVGPNGGPAAGASGGAPVESVTKKNSNVAPKGVSGMDTPVGDELKKQPVKETAGFADLSSFEGPANFSAVEAPAGCYPRDQLTPSDLLPKDQDSIYAQQNPNGPGSLKGKNFLSAGALIGVNTVGQSLRNANLQIRSEPPNPQTPISVFNNSTITYDFSHRPLEIGA
jgi:hypothetical protein